MDLNYLYFRQQVSRFNVDNATCDASREAHRTMTDAYGVLIERAKNDTEPKTAVLEAEHGSTGLAEQVSGEVDRVDRLSASGAIDDGIDGSAAALVRVRVALECHVRNGFGPGW